MPSYLDALEKASPDRSGRGVTGGSALSHRIDFPHRRTGLPPRSPDLANGGPSSSPDVNASEIMQNMIMNDDDKEWYEKLFKKMSKVFLKPTSHVGPGFDVGLNASFVRDGNIIEGLDHRPTSYGVFIQVPIGIVRQLEALYPKMVQREDIDDSPAHVTVLYVGDLNEAQAKILRETIAVSLKNFEPFSVTMNGTGHFDNETSSVFHVKVESPKLTELHHSLKSALEVAGIPLQHRNGDDGIFRGHMTLSYEPPGVHETDLPIKASWVVDRVEVWSMGSPVMVRMGAMNCLGCSVGLCRVHISESKKRKRSLLVEPDNVDKKKKKPKTKEVNAIATGNVTGYTLPLGTSNQTKKQHKKRGKISARAFGGGKVVGKL